MPEFKLRGASELLPLLSETEFGGLFARYWDSVADVDFFSNPVGLRLQFHITDKVRGLFQGLCLGVVIPGFSIQCSGAMQNSFLGL